MLKKSTVQICCDANVQLAVAKAAKDICEVHKARMLLAIVSVNAIQHTLEMKSCFVAYGSV